MQSADTEKLKVSAVTSTVWRRPSEGNIEWRFRILMKSGGYFCSSTEEIFETLQEKKM